MSDIRVFVTFPESSVVFAGETLQCKITFKNVAPVPGTPSPKPHFFDGSPMSPRAGSSGSIGGRQLQVPDGRRSGRVSPRSPAPSPGGHQTSFSMVLPPKSPIAPSSSGNDCAAQKHRRSVSIVSIGSDIGETLNVTPGAAQRGGNGGTSPGLGKSRPGKGHGRSASMQTFGTRNLHSTSPNSGRITAVNNYSALAVC